MNHKTKISRLIGYAYIAILLLFFLSCVERPLDPDQLTRPLPTVVGTEITDYGAHTAAVRGNVQKEGTSNVSSRGFCWSESEDPTVEDNKINAGSGTGEFTATIKGLKPGTRYYIKPFAANNNGTSYGPADSFTTLSIPTVMTDPVTNITPSSAVSGGSISDDGEVEIIARGVCWSTAENPTVQDDTTRDGSGAGSFTSNITGLTPGNQYYVRAYATYADSTQYGNQIQFATTGFNLSGKVTKDGSGLAGVMIMASGGHDQTVETDDTGEYRITGVSYEATVVITPSLYGYDFNPSERTIEDIVENVTGINFTASIETYSISGSVTDDGEGLAGVTITASGDVNLTVTTDNDGEYIITDVLHGSSVVITPGLDGYSFIPSSRSIDNISGDKADVNFTATIDTYTISGTVTKDGSGFGGVTITASGDYDQTVLTNSSGQYTVTNVPHGSNVTITPSLSGHTFDPISRDVDDISSDVTGMDFTATIDTYTISGTVTKDGSGFGGVTITASGDYDQTVTTNSSGQYTVTNVPHGSNVTITPSLSGHTFDPGSRDVNDVSQDVTGVDFTSTIDTYTISGTVTKYGSGLGDVTITVSGDHSQTVTTNSSGQYTVTNVPHGSNVTITPSLSGHTFDPGSRDVNEVSQNVTDLDFTATIDTYIISGTVTKYGSGFGGVTITARGDYSQSVTTNSDGRYTIIDVPHGSEVTLTPNMEGYIFSPTTRLISDISENKTDVDFTAIASYIISGTVTKDGSGLGDVTISASGDHSQMVTTNSNGQYTVTDVPHGSNVTITPNLDDHSFDPNTRDVNDISQDVTGVDFIATEETKGTVTDIDGNTYQTVKIGDQWWMAENLRVTRYRNGNKIPNVKDGSQWSNLTTGAWANYTNDSSHDETYGKLYNWYAVDDDRGLCPEGWRVPTDDDWKQLEMHLGMTQQEADKTVWRGTDEGGKLKSTRTAPSDPHPRWRSPNTGATNESEWSGLPGGYRLLDGYFWRIGEDGYWWSSTEYDTNNAWFRILVYNYSSVGRSIFGKRSGRSVRCLRD